MGKAIWCARVLPFDECCLLRVALFPGGLVYTKLLGKDFIIINSVKVAHDLLEKRSAIYSERPYLPANELCVARLDASRG